MFPRYTVLITAKVQVSNIRPDAMRRVEHIYAVGLDPAKAELEARYCNRHLSAHDAMASALGELQRMLADCAPGDVLTEVHLAWRVEP